VKSVSLESVKTGLKLLCFVTFLGAAWVLNLAIFTVLTVVLSVIVLLMELGAEIRKFSYISMKRLGALKTYYWKKG